jgi:4-aminobutyrate aminotransferase-like enzyme
MGDAHVLPRPRASSTEACSLVGRGGRYGNVLVPAPPLGIEDDVLDRGLDAIAEGHGRLGTALAVFSR